MKLSSIYNKINELLRHLFKPFPILLGVIVSAIEINNYLTPDPIERVLTQIEESQKAISELNMVVIPDSLQTEIIRNARMIQQRLIGYAKIINSCDVVKTENDFYLSSQKARIMNAITASTNASKELSNFLHDLLSQGYLNEFHACAMYIPNSSFIDDEMSGLLENTKKTFSKNLSNKELLKCINDFIASEEFSKWIKSNKDFICFAFEYMNVVQLSMAYDLKMEFNPVAK